MTRFDATAPIFAAGNLHRAASLADGENSFLTPAAIDALSTVDEFVCTHQGCDAAFTSITAFEGHYRAWHQNFCSECGRVLPTAKLLNMHLLECHDTLFPLLAERRPMYECFVEGCEDNFMTRRLRKAHLIDLHKYPKSFKFGEVIGRIRHEKAAKKPAANVSAVAVASAAALGSRSPQSWGQGAGPAEGPRHHDNGNDIDASMEGQGDPNAMEMEGAAAAAAEAAATVPPPPSDPRIPTSLSFGRRGRGGGFGRSDGGVGLRGRGRGCGRGRARATFVCFRCGQPGHVARDCADIAAQPAPQQEPPPPTGATIVATMDMD